MKDRLGLVLEEMERDIRIKRGEIKVLEGQIENIIFYKEQVELLLDEEEQERGA